MLCADNSMQWAGTSILAVIPYSSTPGQATRMDEIWHTFTLSLGQRWSADPTGSLSSPPDSMLNFNIKTKYYTAQVAAVRLDTHPSYHFSDTVEAAEAICLLLDTPLTDTSGTSPLHGFLKDLPDVECKLIVSMGTDGEHESDWELGHLAMDHGFELVHWKATEGEDRWDRVGIERMVEALEATMWQSMRVLGRGSTGSADDEDTDKESECTEVECDVDTAGETPQSPVRDRSIQTDSYGLGQPNSSDDEGADFGEYVAAPSSTDDDALATPFAAFLGDREAKSQGNSSEDADLDGLFAEFARMRDIGTKASDKERRAIAEHAAMSLWRAFGLSDDED